jgi:hypothetical protein
MSMHKKMFELYTPLPILITFFEGISMDFMTCLPLGKKKMSSWWLLIDMRESMIGLVPQGMSHLHFSRPIKLWKNIENTYRKVFSKNIC